VCPPVVEHEGVQAKAAEEVQALPDGSSVVEMLSGYAVMQEQISTSGCKNGAFHT